MTKSLLLSIALVRPVFGDLTLFYKQPATDWQTQALPIGNGRLGAMIFGDPIHEHIQLNEISLWTGDEKNMGSYQNLGDLTFDLAHGPATSYRRELDLGSAIHTITYTADGVPYKREYFASAPQHALIFRYDQTTDRRVEIKVDLEAVMKGQAEDIRLIFDDIILVPNQRQNPKR